MQFFRMRLILALIIGITLVSLASTYFDVLAHKHFLRKELEHRSAWLGASLKPEMEQAVASGRVDAIDGVIQRMHNLGEMLGLAVYTPGGRLLAAAGPEEVLRALPPSRVETSIRRNEEVTSFGHSGDWEWLEDAFPLQETGQLNGVLVIVEDARFIRAEGNAVWQRSFWRIVAFVLLIVAVTLLMVRWFLMRPMIRVAERLRLLRMGHEEKDTHESIAELSLFTPLAREVQTMAESLIEARAVAQAEARLRDAGEHVWTAERLAVHVRERFGSSRIFVVSNREPYMHLRRGGETVCVVPPSGLVTAIEPVLRACDGVWVAHGNGSEDPVVVDEFDRLRVPPDDPRYTLRRVWLSSEEESGYYDGFSNEGIWPLCHIAHTRPIFRASDWECYQRVNQKFADALVEEMEGCESPIVFVQDYHFALLPRLIKAARPDARVAIFWHIPWPNPESFGIFPWQAELIDGLLGADLIGFHIALHCDNFLATVDRVVEARTDREHMTARRHGHLTAVRPYPVSVALDGLKRNEARFSRNGMDSGSKAFTRQLLLDEFDVRCETLALGVDRLDYTKGIVERLVAIEQLLEDHPWHRERLTMVQIAAPSRTRIPSYVELRRQVEETAERINQRFQTAHWKPIMLIERQCSHEEVDRWYRAADLCLVTSLHDGMNLVAKEYLAARDDEDGVLVLSKFTGAAIELRDALLVNPYDTKSVAEAIHQGLEMSRAERRTRVQRMRQHLMDHNIYRWAANILGDLRELRIESPQQDADRGPAGPTVVSATDGTHRKLA
ncbi:MAG TPA: trehalose-6-phosphate synthase [Terracidiphilus sp.]|jgi:trehalose 6-phosphate synthase